VLVERSGSDQGEVAEVGREVTLVEVAGRARDVGPATWVLLGKREGTLKAGDSGECLRAETDSRTEGASQMALADSDGASDGVDILSARE
jgi:hypothetical protein